MNKIYKILTIILSAFAVYSCQSDADVNDGVGYLTLNVETVTVVNSNSRVGEEYNPKQLAIKVADEDGNVYASTDDYTLWKDKAIRLNPGKYIVSAYSYDESYNGQNESGFDIPYYAGQTTVTIEAGKSTNTEVTCTLANVKVSVEYDQTFKDAFASANATISSALTGIATQKFEMGAVDQKSAYFPVANVTSTITVVNKYGGTYRSSYQATNVAARDHLIFKYSTGTVGNASITVTVEGGETVYNFYFPVSMAASTSFAMAEPNTWAHEAYLTASIAALESGKTLDSQYMTFEYKAEGATEWSTIAATEVPAAEQKDYKYTATLTNLQAGTKYVARLKYVNGADSYVSSDKSFTTEAETQLPYSNMDTWVKSGKTWYLGEAKSFWDSSNPGTTTGVGAAVNKNPTQGNSSIVHTAGGQSAELQSQYASAVGIGKFAAASLYTGQFNSLVGANGAKIDFGREFTTRPTQLKGWFRYTTGTIDYCGSGQPANTVKEGDTDLWSAYIVLTTGGYTLDNTDMAGTSKDFNALLNDPNDTFVVGYGALPDASCVAAGDWTQFTIDIKYKNLVTKPTHVIVVFSSSKYGDYFTGSTSSLLYLDDLELVYGTPTIVTK
jgi:hypothetical protein